MARDCGDISSLFPPGVTRLWDLPYTIHSAIRMALYFIGFEEYRESERPPKRIWLDADKMKQWWQDVKAAREEEGKGNGAINDMPQNALMKEMFGNRIVSRG